MSGRNCVRATAKFVLPVIVSFPVVALAQSPLRVTTDGGLLEAGFASTTIDGYARSSLSAVASSLWGARDRISGAGTGTVTRFASGNASAYGEASGAFALSSDPRNLSSLRVDFGGGAYRGRASSQYAAASGLVGRSSAAAGHAAVRAAWAQATIGRVGGAEISNTVRATVGAWARSEAATISGTLSYSGVASHRYVDVTASAQWSPFGRPGSGPRLLAGADGGVRIAANMPGRSAWLAGTAAISSG
ncbi:MAG: hypothetical protein ACHQQP_07210, partial [Gemmatimonadales bacterium]